jgi:hypothetical protein
MKLGDLVERLAHPIAVALKLPCLDALGRLRKGSPCDLRRQLLNDLFPRLGSSLRPPAAPPPPPRRGPYD